MARDLKCVRMILIIGLCLMAGLPACDRADSQPVTTVPPTPVARDSNAGQVVITKPLVEPAKEADLPDVSPADVILPQQVFRPDDRRTPHDDARLKEAGIRSFESKRLKLYTDIDAEVAETLPPLIDQVYLAWENELGPLSPDHAGTDFQITGYLIRDLARFRELRLVPEQLFLEHGRHRLNEFWMRDQAFDYYRRHLLIHEATHCFMTFLPDVQAPIWYLEGMAEYFASHQLSAEKRATFGVIPTSPKEFAGFGRIELIREDVASNRALTISAICAFQPAEFRTTNHYAWSWALCVFLDRNPRYHERFQALSGFMQGSQFPRMFSDLFQPGERDMMTEWTLFSFNLQYGYDIVRAAIDFQPGTPLDDEHRERLVQVESDRGWQSSQVRLEAGQTYEVIATGQFTLSDQPKLWVSEPQGITYRYFDGRPIGMLLGCVRTENGPAGGEGDSMLHRISLGRGLEFQSPFTGTLYLRLNDAWNSLHDNRGHIAVTVRRVDQSGK